MKQTFGVLAALAASALANDLVTTSKAEWGPFSVTDDASQAVMTYSGATYWREALEGEDNVVYNIRSEGVLSESSGDIEEGDSLGQWQCWERSTTAYACHVISISKNAAQTTMDWKRYALTAMPTITDADTDPTTIFAGTGAAESHSVMSLSNTANSQPSINVVTAGSHELLSASTITDNSFKAVVKGDLTTEG